MTGWGRGNDREESGSGKTEGGSDNLSIFNQLLNFRINYYNIKLNVIIK